MSHPTAPTLSPTIIETILTRLAVLFLIGANGNPNHARQAAQQILAAYNPQTEDELTLAADIISFSFQALEALSQAASPDISLNQKLRLRGSAVNLSRESHKAQRRLDQLQRVRHTAAEPVQPQARPSQPCPQPAGPQPVAEQPGAEQPAAPHSSPNRPQVQPADLPQPPRPTAPAPAPKQAERLTWTQNYQKRLADKRLARKMKNNPAASNPRNDALLPA